MDTSEITIPEPPAFELEEGHLALNIPRLHAAGRSFVEGDPEGNRLRIWMSVRESDHRLFAKVWFGPDAEGPPLHAHGGSMAAVLDHVMGVGGWVSGHPVVAANISVSFHKSLPLGIVVTAEAWVEKVDGRKVTCAARLYGDDVDKPFASSEGLFISQPMEKFQNLYANGKSRNKDPEKS